jgi:hypothetical protein
MNGNPWRYFGTREAPLARVWARDGGVAVHENLYRLKGRRTAHLLAADEARLLVAARAVGCEDRWIQRANTLHFDLVAEYLDRALTLCGVDPAAPPARRVWSDGSDRPLGG